MSELDQYDYELPSELIAQQPLPCRSDARMMVVNRAVGSIEHAYIRDLPDFIEARDGLVLNDTQVIPARLVGYRTETGGRWSGLYLRTTDTGVWEVLCKTRGKLKDGETVTLQDRKRSDGPKLVMLADLGGGRWAVAPEQSETAGAVLRRFGRVPLPPYIRGGEMQSADIDKYQTVYAKRPGAVAAPTAGLHFTDGLLAEIEAKGTEVCRLTLHVGVGTFRPISADRLDEHEMHSEWGQVDQQTVDCLNQVRRSGGRVVAVGTTSVRLLETASQSGSLCAWQGSTDLFIRPPFTFNTIDALLTNFHLPRSTLVILVRTFGGDELVQRAYAEAIMEQYRFYSYGDAMLIV